MKSPERRRTSPESTQTPRPGQGKPSSPVGDDGPSVAEGEAGLPSAHRPPGMGSQARTPLRLEGGLAALGVGGLLFLGSLFDLRAAPASATVTGVGFSLGAYTLAPLAFAAVQCRQERVGGILGRVGTVVAVVGSVLMGAITFVEFAQVTGVDVGSVFQAAGARWVSSFGALVYVFGILLFGASVVRGKALPASGGITLIVGTIVTSAATLSLGAAAYVGLVGAAITGFGFIRLGATLLVPSSRGS